MNLAYNFAKYYFVHIYRAVKMSSFNVGYNVDIMHLFGGEFQLNANI